MPRKKRMKGALLVQVAQSMVEYAIIAAIVAAVALIAVRGLGTSVSGLFTRAESCVTQAQSPNGTC